MIQPDQINKVVFSGTLKKVALVYAIMYSSVHLKYIDKLCLTRYKNTWPCMYDWSHCKKHSVMQSDGNSLKIVIENSYSSVFVP